MRNFLEDVNKIINIMLWSLLSMVKQTVFMKGHNICIENCFYVVIRQGQFFPLRVLQLTFLKGLFIWKANRRSQKLFPFVKLAGKQEGVTIYKFYSNMP